MELKFNGKTINIRKWKAKDRKTFVSEIKNKNLDSDEIKNALVYDCIDEDVILSPDEFRYVLSRIRAYSLGENIHFEIICSECGNEFELDIDLKDIFKTSFEDKKEIIFKDINIKISDIKNKEYYNKLLSENTDDLYLIDFLMRIDSINGNDSYTLEELISYFNNLDIDLFDGILEQWENIRFKIDDVHSVKCPSCNNIHKYKFDELPEFFPTKWFK